MKRIKKITKVNQVRIRCCRCKKLVTLTVGDPELYTPEVRNNWCCVLCSPEDWRRNKT